VVKAHVLIGASNHQYAQLLIDLFKTSCNVNLPFFQFFVLIPELLNIRFFLDEAVNFFLILFLGLD